MSYMVSRASIVSVVPRLRSQRVASASAKTAAYLAVGVAAAWHLVALAVVGAGLYLTGADIATGQTLHPVDALPGAIALFVLLTLRPRGHRFIVPGPRLLRGEHPAFFRALDEATSAVGLARYDEVYVDATAHGRVVQRDGVLGIGGRRTLVIGAPLLQTMSVDHLKALVAHEAARYHGPLNDLAALVERTRARMRAGLDELAGGGGGLTSLPFQILAGFFLRTTSAFSRDHRFATDALVARNIGGWQMVEMLRLTSGLPSILEAYGSVYAGRNGPRFEDYVVSEDAARVLAFARFRDSESTAASTAEPHVDERLHRLHQAAADSCSLDERPAAELLHGFPDLAARQMADRFALR